MRILLTGSTGFIGSALARLAMQRGHQVAGLVLPSETIPDSLLTPGFTILRGTLQSAPWKEISAFKADACVHAAWITQPGVYLESPANYTFLDQSLEFLRGVWSAGTRYVVVLGTCIEYRISHEILSEATTPVEPTTTYARCKNELRLKLEAEAAREGFRLCWARIFYPYGPGEHPSRLCSSLIERLRRAETVMLKTPGSTKDYIFIDDLAEALLTLLERRYEGTINLGTGVGVTVREIGLLIADLMQRPGLIRDAEKTEIDPLGYVVADARLVRNLGWRPRHDLMRGLRELLEVRGVPLDSGGA